ncbi:MAG: 50S ribosomal protein L31e [Thermoplasmatota archaeon]
MAKDAATTELERIYTIPLRDTKDLTRGRRADNAVRDVKRFLQRHMKSQAIWLDQEVNESLWSTGKFRIPSRIRVRATRFSDGVVEVTLPDTEHAGSVRTEIAERREKAAESPVLKAPAPKEPEEGDRPVTDVKGVGPVTAEKLEKAGIHGVADLAKADPAKIAEAAGVSTEKAAAWHAEAKALADKAAETAPAAEDAAPAEAKPEEATPDEAKPDKAEP